jgi:hypothetical protein
MTTYLLDTNACIALINGTEINVRRRFQRAVARDGVMLLSAILPMTPPTAFMSNSRRVTLGSLTSRFPDCSALTTGGGNASASIFKPRPSAAVGVRVSIVSARRRADRRAASDK